MWSPFVTKIIALLVCVAPGSVAADLKLMADEKQPAKAATEQVMTVFWKTVLQVVAAPKLHYQVTKLEVYRNGVWAEYKITNQGAKRIYLDVARLDRPVEHMELVDPHGRQWEVPHFQGYMLLGPPDSFVSIEPGKSIEYRSKLSLARKPLQMVKGPAVPAPMKPSELSYRISVWSGGAYSRLTEEDRQKVLAVAFGFGKATVEWIDDDFPKSWSFQRRLD